MSHNQLKVRDDAAMRRKPCDGTGLRVVSYNLREGGEDHSGAITAFVATPTGRCTPAVMND